MTVRFFFSGSTSPFVPSAYQGTWDSTESAAGDKILTTTNSGWLNGSNAVSETTATSPWRVAVYRMTSAGADSSGTIGGTVQWMFGVGETSGALMTYRAHVYVTAGDTNTVRLTLLSNFTGSTEWPVGAAGTTDGAQALTGGAITAGDRIVAEFGYSAANTSTSSMTGTMSRGSPGTALTAGDSAVSSHPGWVEFSDLGNVFGGETPAAVAGVQPRMSTAAVQRAASW